MKYFFLSMIFIFTLYADDSVYKLGKIEIVETNDVSQNKTSTIIDKPTIKDTQSHNVVEALQVVPGIIVQKIGAKNLTEIKLRGFNHRRVPIYIDGVPVYVPYNRETDLGHYTTYDVSEIDVSKGYVSPMHGPNTLGGAVNIITRKPRKEIEGEIKAGIFSGKGRQEGLTLGTNQGKYYALLSVLNYQRDYFKLSDDFVPAGKEDGGRRENSDSKDFKLNTKIGFTPNDTDEYSFNYIMQKSRKGQPYYASDYESSSSWETREWRWPKWDKTSYYFISKIQVLENTILKTRLFYDKFYNKLIDLNKGWNSKFDDYSVGLSTQLDLNLSDTRVLKFLAMQKNDYHKDIFSLSPGLDIKAQGQTQSLGLEHSWALNDKFKWIVGLNYDINKVNKAQYRNKKTINNWDTYDTSFLSPQTALYYQLNDDATIFGSVGIRSNMPSLKNRYSTRFGTSIPNPNLKAEKATNYELGLEQMLSNTYMKSSVFFVNSDNYIQRIDVPLDSIFCTGSKKSKKGKKSECYQLQNIGQEQHLGFETAFDSYWSDNLSTNLSYTLMDFKLKKNASSKRKYITGLPKHSLNFFAKYKPISNLSFIPKVHYESSRYVSNEAPQPTTKSFVVADFQATYQISGALELNAGINNIFDRFYYYAEGYPTQGRNFYTTLRYKF